jgi:hypothetical protein
MSVVTDSAWSSFSDEVDKMARIDTFGLHYNYSLSGMYYTYMIIKALEYNDINSHYTDDEVASLESQLAVNCCNVKCNC